MTPKIKIILGFVVVAAVVIILLWRLPYKAGTVKPLQNQTETAPVQATQTAPAKTTTVKTQTGWLTARFSDLAGRGSFQYPASLGTKYISLQDWPPKILIANQQFTCTEAGSENSPAGLTQRQEINGRIYCVTRESGAAAGSVYTSYAYALQVAPMKIAILTFSLRFPQCANYPEPKNTECQTEKNTFDLSPTIDKIFKSLIVQ